MFFTLAHWHTSAQYPPPDSNGADQITTVLSGKVRSPQPSERNEANIEKRRFVTSIILICESRKRNLERGNSRLKSDTTELCLLWCCKQVFTSIKRSFRPIRTRGSKALNYRCQCSANTRCKEFSPPRCRLHAVVGGPPKPPIRKRQFRTMI